MVVKRERAREGDAIERLEYGLVGRPIAAIFSSLNHSICISGSFLSLPFLQAPSPLFSSSLVINPFILFNAIYYVAC